MEAFLTIIILILAIFPLKKIYYLFRISEKRQNTLNIFVSLGFGTGYLVALCVLDNTLWQLGLVAATELITGHLLKKYMAIINHEYREKLLDDLQAKIERYDRLNQKK